MVPNDDRPSESVSIPFLFVTWAFTALLSADCTTAMQLTSTGPQTLQRAQGERVTLGCTYTPGPMDTGELDIEWSVVSPDTTQKDQLLLSYAGGKRYLHGSSVLTTGMGFDADDPSQGDASLAITSLTPLHSATYQCKVKKSPGVDMRKVSLVVMAKPSVPKCWVEGGEAVGQTAVLHCKSDQGSTPITYSWQRARGGTPPLTAAQNAVTGQLVISNHSEALAGTYLCEAANAVGAERCRINLRAVKPPNKAGVIAGTVVGSLLLIILLFLLVCLVIYKFNDRSRYEKEVSNEIREDVAPPESRPASRDRSRGPSLHLGVAYSQVDGSPASCSNKGLTKPTPPDSKAHTPVKYDCVYGYAV